MATRDPNGNATTGIVRKATSVTYFERGSGTADPNGYYVKQNSQGGSDAWNTSQYLNMWVCNFGGASANLLGYGTFPGGNAAYDGVVMGYKYFGVNPATGGAFGYGRTATHEVGHWLNLYHIWGDDGTACTGTDNVADTPNQADENYGCPTFGAASTVSCSNGPNGDMFMNYMDYTDDQCMNMFSAGQKTRARVLFDTGGPRASLLTSPALGAPCPCPSLTGLSPLRNALGVASASNLTLTFSQAISNASASNAGIRVFSSQYKGLRTLNGTFTGGGSSTVTFNPAVDFRPGEVVSVTASSAITGTSGAVTPAGHVYQFTVASGRASGAFTAAADVAVGTSPYGVATADVNNDGNLDLLAANLNSSTVSVRLGNGLGAFSNGTDVTVGSSPRGLTIADVNNDGNPDLLTANYTPSNVSVRLGNGTGGFTSPATPEVAVLAGPMAVAAADINGDGNLDFLATNYNNPGYVNVQLGDGTGGFTSAGTALAAAGPQGLTLADLNNDGEMDLVTANTSAGGNNISIRLGNGAGTFTAPTTGEYAMGTNPYRVVAADVNGDGNLDVLVANAGSNNVSLRLGDGTGALGVLSNVAVGSTPYGLAVADLNGDGKLDLLATTYATAGAAPVRLGNGDGTFSTATTLDVTGLGSRPRAVAVADLNNDGAADMVTANESGNSLSVRLGVPAPVLSSFTPANGTAGTVVTITGNYFTSATAVAFNGTAAASFVVNSATSITATVAAGTTTGPISVTTPSGTGTSATSFLVNMTPPGNALAFDGSDDYVSAPTAPTFGTGNFAIEAWVRTQGASNTNYVAVGSVGGGQDYWLGMSNGRGAISVSGGTACTGTTLINDNRWHHLAGVRNGSQLTIYVDGVAENTTTNSLSASPSAALGIGYFAGSGGYHWPGSIDEVRVWNVARTPAQVNTDRLTIATLPQTGLVRYYNFDQGTAGGTNAGQNTLLDQTSSAFNGTLAGFGLSGPSSNWVESYAMAVPAATAATALSSSGFTANWTAPAVGTVTNYLLDVSTSATFASAIIGSPFTVAAGTTSRSVTGLTAGTTYYYRVRADKTSVAGQGTPSNSQSAAVPCPVQAVAQNVSTALGANGTATITAAAVNNGSTANCGPAAAAALSLSQTSFGCADLTPANVTSTLSFDGTNDFIAIGSSSPVPVGNSTYTIEAWIKPTQMGAYGIIGWGNYNTTNQVNALRLSPTGIINYWWDNDLTVGTTDLSGAWHHVAATFDGTTRKLYLDGVLIGQDTPAGHAVPNANNLRIGSTNNAEYFPGQIDEVRVWNRARTATELNHYKGVGLRGTETGLVAYLRLNEGSGSTTADATGNAANLGTLTNAPTWAAAGAPVVNGTLVMLTVTDVAGNTSTAPAVVTVQDNTAPVALARNVTVTLGANGTATLTGAQLSNGSSDNCGVATLAASPSSFTCANVSPSAGPANRYALDFDGTNDRVDLGASILTGGSYTKEAWVYARANNCRNILSANNQQQLWVPGALNAGHQTSYSTVVDPGGSFPLNTWVHVAVSYDAATSTMRLYRNGALVASNTAAPTYASAILSIGAHGTTGGCNWDGRIDEVRIWNTVRTAAEIQATKDVTLTGAETGLQAYYTFEDGPNASTLTDVTGHGYHGTLVNMSATTAWVTAAAPATGGTLVTLTATDAAGNVSTATATVTVSMPVTPTTTWSGDASTAWTECGNWSYGKVPDATTHVVIPAGMSRYPNLTAGTWVMGNLTVASGASLTLGSAAALEVHGDWTNNGTASLAGAVAFRGSAAQALGGSSPSSFATLVVNKTGGSTLTLQRPTSVTGTLTMTSGLLATGAYSLTTTGATLTETSSSYVLGNVVSTATMSSAGTRYAFGNLGVALTPGGFTLPGATTVRRVTGTALAGNTSSSSVRRYYEVTPATNAGLNVALEFAYFDTELNGLNESLLGLFRSSAGTSGPWQHVPASSRNATANTLTATGLTQLGVFALGSSANPLPVELVAFSAERRGEGALLRWTTAQETDNAYFEVEASVDGQAFRPLGRVAGHGSSSVRHDYQFTDAQLRRHGVPLVYYRLRQVDLDGDEHLSPVRTLQLEAGSELLVTAFPNPSQGAVTLRVQLPQASATQLLLRDALGRLLLTQALTLHAGTTELPLPALARLPRGVYFLTVQTPAQQRVIQLTRE
ncbi:hypothetical protein GCM10027048_27470 [Hymenobacter coalescens]